eukprot:bmy_02230T0
MQRVDLTVSGDSVTGIPQPPRIPSEAAVGSKVRWTSAPRARRLWGSVDLARCNPSWCPLVGQLVLLTMASQGTPLSVPPMSIALPLPPGLNL